jgi:hypothetical protein
MTADTGNPPTLRLVVWSSAAVVAIVCATYSADHAVTVAERAIDGRLTWGFPLVLDGLAIAGSARLVDDHRAHRASPLSAYAAALLGLVGSLAANVVGVVPDLVTDRQVQLVVAVYPPVALALLVHLGLRYLADVDPAAAASPDLTADRPDPRPVDRPARATDRTAPTPLSAALAADLDRGRVGPVSPTAALPAVSPPSAVSPPASPRADLSRTADRPAGQSPAPDDVLSAVRAIAAAEGRCPGRDVVARKLRERGMSVATNRVGEAVRVVKAERVAVAA